MRAFVDRIENGIAVHLLGDDESIEVGIPVAWLPSAVREGVCLRVDFTIDVNATDTAQMDTQSLLGSLGNEP